MHGVGFREKQSKHFVSPEKGLFLQSVTIHFDELFFGIILGVTTLKGVTGISEEECLPEAISANVDIMLF
jgi:hypothetical protein